MNHFFTALQFLTPLPIGKVNVVSDKDLAKSMAWFGMAGLFIGIILAVAYIFLSIFLPKIVVSVFIVLLMVILSRGLHLDGLADTIDGVTGGKDKADTLRIMHDSNIGAIGAAAIFICLLIKFASIYSIGSAARALIVSSVISRWVFVFSAKNWKPVLENEGLGRKFINFIGKKELFWSTLTAIAVALFILSFKGIAIIALTTFFIAAFNNFIKHKIGGLTGDTLGACGEMAECFSLAMMSVLIK